MPIKLSKGAPIKEEVKIAVQPAKKRKRKNKLSRAQYEAAFWGPNATESGKSPNPMDPRTGRTVAQLGNTGPGRSWALKYLHPMVTSTVNPKAPDGAYSMSAMIERRDLWDVGCPIPPPATGEGPNWNLVIIAAPFLRYSTIVCAWPVTITPTLGDLQTVVYHWDAYQDTSEFHYWHLESDLTVDGVYVKVLPCSTWDADGGERAMAGHISKEQTQRYISYAKAFRRTYCGYTTAMSASDLYNEGVVVAGQWKADCTKKPQVQSVTTGSVDVRNTWVYNYPPAFLQDIEQADEKKFDGEAKNGVYMPLRLWEPTVCDTQSVEYFNTRGVVNTDLPPEGIANEYDALNYFLKGWGFGVINYSGLDYKATIRISRVEGLELVPAQRSVYGPIATSAYADDNRAFQLAREITREQKHGFPSDYNDLGGMLGNILAGIGNAVGNLGIPVISDIARPVGNILGGLADNIIPL